MNRLKRLILDDSECAVVTNCQPRSGTSVSISIARPGWGRRTSCRETCHELWLRKRVRRLCAWTEQIEIERSIFSSPTGLCACSSSVSMCWYASRFLQWRRLKDEQKTLKLPVSSLTSVKDCGDTECVIGKRNNEIGKERGEGMNKRLSTKTFPSRRGNSHKMVFASNSISTFRKQSQFIGLVGENLLPSKTELACYGDVCRRGPKISWLQVSCFIFKTSNDCITLLRVELQFQS